jgi:hypothetical protein
MSGPTFSLKSTYRPTEGTGTIRITFPDVRKSSRKNAEELVNKQIADLMKRRPANTVITASLKEGSRFASSWTYELSTTTAPATPARPAPIKRK